MKPILLINPPPQDRACQVCGKKVRLTKTFRSMAEKKTDKELEIMFDGHCGEDRDFYEQVMNTVEASWECDDCLNLEDEEYFKKKFKDYKKEVV